MVGINVWGFESQQVWGYRESSFEAHDRTDERRIGGASRRQSGTTVDYS